MGNQAKIVLQPKQGRLLDLVESSVPSWIGVGGGRGGAKSGGLQRVMLQRRIALPGTVGAIVMRNYDQVKRYHIDVMMRDYPQLLPYFHKGESKISLPVANGPNSEIHFTYAESLQEVIRRFRSANYYDVFIDQAEQFSEAELREMKQCVRWAGASQGSCKMVLAFNMGGAGIDFLRRKFHSREYNELERPEDYAFIHVFPWDNVEWVREALKADGLTEKDYYAFSEEQRQAYCASRSDYGRNLVSQDEPLRKRDWLGSWESLEGAYFARVYDKESTVLEPEQVSRLVKPWWPKWISQDWGRSHYCSTHWHARGDISPKETLEVLGWEVRTPVSAVVTYREYLAGGGGASDEGADRKLAEQDIARDIVKLTPEAERKVISHFFLSPDAFAKKSSANTIAEGMGEIVRVGGLPYPEQADNDRVGGWGLMYNLLLASKRHDANEECWLISANCPEALRTIPLLMRDPKNLDDVLKTDHGQAKIEQDVGDDLRYGLKSLLSPRQAPYGVQKQEVMTAVLERQPDLALAHTQQHLASLRFDRDWKKSHGAVRRSLRWARG